MPDILTNMSLCSAEYVLDGACFDSADNISVAKASVDLTLLHEWAGVSGFVVSGLSGERPISIKYEFPEDIVLVSTPSLTARLRFTLEGLSRSHVQREVSLRQTPRLLFEFPESILWHDLLILVGRFQLFFAWASSWPSQICALDIWSDTTQPPIHVYFRAKTYECPEFVSDSDMLFTCDDLRSMNGQATHQWFTQYDTLEPLFELYARDMYSEELSLELAFLSLMQAAEILYSRLYRRNRKDIEMISGLYDRMCKVLDGVLTNDTGFAREVIIERNSIVHNNPHKKLDKKRAEHLHELYYTVRLTLDTALLKWLGAPDEVIRSIIKRNRQYSHLLRHLNAGITSD